MHAYGRLSTLDKMRVYLAADDCLYCDNLHGLVGVRKQRRMVHTIRERSYIRGHRAGLVHLPDSSEQLCSHLSVHLLGACEDHAGKADRLGHGDVPPRDRHTCFDTHYKPKRGAWADSVHFLRQDRHSHSKRHGVQKGKLFDVTQTRRALSFEKSWKSERWAHCRTPQSDRTEQMLQCVWMNVPYIAGYRLLGSFWRTFARRNAKCMSDLLVFLKHTGDIGDVVEHLVCICTMWGFPR